MRGEGFEPANDFRADLESASVGHLDTLAKSACIYLRESLMKVCTFENTACTAGTGGAGFG